MSLRTFHLLFIAASALMALGLAAWGVDAYAARGGTEPAVLAAGGLLLGAALVVYGLKVRAKLKGVGRV